MFFIESSKEPLEKKIICSAVSTVSEIICKKVLFYVQQNTEWKLKVVLEYKRVIKTMKKWDGKSATRQRDLDKSTKSR